MSETTEATALDSFGREVLDRKQDEAGRILVPELTDREIKEETLATLRVIADAIAQITANPGAMMSRFMPGMSGIMGAMTAVQQGR